MLEMRRLIQLQQQKQNERDLGSGPQINQISEESKENEQSKNESLSYKQESNPQSIAGAICQSIQEEEISPHFGRERTETIDEELIEDENINIPLVSDQRSNF